MIEYKVRVSKGSTKWFLNDQFHREDGPAVEWANGDKCWYINGERHRLDGSAVEGLNGYKEWWIEGKEYTEKEFNKVTQPKPNLCSKIVEIEGKKYKLIEVE